MISLQKIKIYCKRHAPVLAAMAIFFFGSFIIWQHTPFRDIGGNLFASAIQLFFTFFIFERVIAHQKEAGELPRKLSAYEDTCIWFNQMTWFYQAAYRSVNPEKKARKIADMLHVDFFRQMLRLELDKEAPVIPSKTWEQFIVKQSGEFSEKGRKILERDGDRLPPEVCRAIHIFATSPFLAIQKHLTTVREISSKHPTMARPPVWLYHSVEPSTEEIDALHVIYNWLCDFHSTHSKSMPKLVKVPETW